MISRIKQSTWSDVALGVLKESVSSGFQDITVKVTFDDGIRPFPEPNPPYMFVIGGKRRTYDSGSKAFTTIVTNNREVVMCKEKVSDTEYTVSRDPMNTGARPPSHSVNEEVYQNTMAGAILGSMNQLEQMTSREGQIAYLEELLLVLFGSETTLIDKLWPEYDNFLVHPSNPPSDVVRIAPGGYFVRNSIRNGIVKLLVIAPYMEIYGRSNIALEFPPDQSKCRALVYINNDGEIETFYGEPTTKLDEEPPEIVTSSIDGIHQPLAEIYLDSTTESKVVTLEYISDLREWPSNTEEGVVL